MRIITGAAVIGLANEKVAVSSGKKKSKSPRASVRPSPLGDVLVRKAAVTTGVPAEAE